MDLSKRNYIPANTDGSRTVAVICYLFAVLSVILVALRFSSRKLRGIPYGIDDWLILIALPTVLGHLAIILVAVYLGGVGHRPIDLDPSTVIVLLKALTAFSFSFGVSLGLIKASILCLLMRIFNTKRFKLLARLTLAYVVCWTILCILIGSALCRPYPKNWDSSVPGVCGDRMAAYIAMAAADIVGDLMIVFLPMSNIWRLQTSLRIKIALSIIFAVGLLDVTAGILRVIYLVQAIRTMDYTYGPLNCWIWTALEPALAVFVACSPTLKPLLEAMKRRGKSAGTLPSGRNTCQSSHKTQLPSEMLDYNIAISSVFVEEGSKKHRKTPWDASKVQAISLPTKHSPGS